MNTLLDVSALTHRFGGLRVANDISLSLRPGDRTALIGPNGAGKTTFINLITGRIRPQAGRVLLDGADITTASDVARVRAGLVRSFQITRLFRDMGVLEHLMLSILARDGKASRTLSSMSSFSDARAEATALLDKVGLLPVATARVGDLAYGQQRMLEIGLALALRPKVLLLDEPAAGVAQSEVPRILELMAALPSDLAVLMIDHDLDLVFRFATRILVMSAGELIADGAAADVMADERVRQVYIGGYGREN